MFHKNPEELNLLESLILTAECSGVIPVDVFMSGDRFDNDNTELGWNEFTLWQQTQDDLEGNVGLDNICPGHADDFDPIEHAASQRAWQRIQDCEREMSPSEFLRANESLINPVS